MSNLINTDLPALGEVEIRFIAEAIAAMPIAPIRIANALEFAQRLDALMLMAGGSYNKAEFFRVAFAGSRLEDFLEEAE